MKKIIALLSLIMLLLAQSISLAESFDFSSYDDAALLDMLAAIQQEIADRHIEKSATLPEGTYTVGKDIPAGSYNIYTKNTGIIYRDIYVYDENGTMLSDFTAWQPSISSTNGEYNFYVTLEKGQTIKTGIDITLTISGGIKFN